MRNSNNILCKHPGKEHEWVGWCFGESNTPLCPLFECNRCLILFRYNMSTNELKYNTDSGDFNKLIVIKF